MRPAVPLSEFMPYGAPELLESRQRHMSRALVFTSALALLVYGIAGGLAPLFAVAPEVPRPVVVRPEVIDIIRAHQPEAEPERARPAAAVIHKAAKPIPVDDDIAPPSEVPAPTAVVSDDKGTGTAIAPSDGETVGPTTDKLPMLGEWVYVEREPAPIVEVKPEYPRMAWEAGVEGRVTVHVLIGKDGRVIDAVLAKGFQVPMLNDAALTAARAWRFTPGIANGHPVTCWTAIPFNFRLH
jgi:TonB family protein